MSQTQFQQAPIEIQAKEQYQALHDAIARILAPTAVEKFLRKLDSKGLRIRRFEAIVTANVLDQLDGVLAGSGKAAQQLYQQLPTSDQAQLREFYLTAVESVEDGLRAKYAKIYRTY